MKTDVIEFDTKKDVEQIANALRTFKCQMERLKDDPLSNGTPPAIAVVMCGKATMLDAFKHAGAGKSEWGVQVIVTDLGNRRHVELIALGESGVKQAFSAYRATGGGLFSGYGSLSNQYFNIRHSKDYRDRIAEMIS